MVMMDRAKEWVWFAVAALMLVDAIGYTVGAIAPIRQALSPVEPSGRSGCCSI